MRCRIVIGTLLLFAHVAAHATQPVEEKNFLLLSLIEKIRAVARVIEADHDLDALRRAKVGALHAAATTCGADGECINARMRWSDADIEAAASSLRRSYDANGPVRELIDGRVRKSNAYVRYGDKRGGDLLAAVWVDSARAMNNIIDVYGSGKAPHYPAIDAVSFDVKSEAYTKLLHTVVASLEEEPGPLFFQPVLRYALHLLDINHRDEAGRFEPLDSGVNAAAVRRIASIQWDRFPYTVIVVPGFGPEREGWALAPEGKLRIELAARRFRQGKAPLILVSGGYVHPNQTPYCEAIEMKNALIADFGIPADAIVVEPHARHTTTNLRNAARLMSRYGTPFDKKALITTDTYQSAYIESDAFAKRCDQDFGYQPAKTLKRVSDFDLEFTPRIDSLQIDPMDPLDP